MKFMLAALLSNLYSNSSNGWFLNFVQALRNRFGVNLTCLFTSEIAMIMLGLAKALDQ